jgi:putative DNA methylase
VQGGSAQQGRSPIAHQQRWSKESPVARLMEALIHAAPQALRHEHGTRSAAAQFPEFRAWHALLQPLFAIPPPDWAEKPAPQIELLGGLEAESEEPEELEMDTDGDGEDSQGD